ALEQFVKYSDGVSEVYILRPDELRWVIGLVTAEEKTKRLLEVVRMALKYINRPTDQPPLCFNLSCKYTFNKHKLPTAIIVLVPLMQNWVNDASQLIAQGACPTCSTMPDEEISRIVIKNFGGNVLQTGHA